MDALTFISNLIQFLAWPLAILVIFTLFHKEARGLLTRLTRFEGPGVNVEFGKGLEEAEKKADEAALPRLAGFRETREPNISVQSLLYRIR